MKAVAFAIVNRFRIGRWFSGSCLAECCLLPYQFSSWNTNDPNRRAMAKVTDSIDSFHIAKQVLQIALAGSEPDPTNGATHYYSTTMKPPAWTTAATLTAMVGRQKFYKDVA